MAQVTGRDSLAGQGCPCGVVGVILLVTLAVVLPACATGSRQDAAQEQEAPVEERQAVTQSSEAEEKPAGKYEAALARVRQWRSALR